MSVHDRLMDEERIVLQHPPFYLTTHRLLRWEDVDGTESFREIALRGMTEVERVRVTDHRILALGAALIASGVILTATWAPITAPLAIIFGIVAIALGSKGKVAGYQVRSPRIPERELELWRLPAWGAENFVGKLRDIAVENQDPYSQRY